MVVLPNITFCVQDCHFPIKPARAVVLNVYNLPPGARENFRAIRGDHIDAVMKVGCAAIILIRLDYMPHLHHLEGPGVDRMRPVRAAPGKPRRPGLDCVIQLGFFFRRVGWLGGGSCARENRENQEYEQASASEQ